MAPSLHSPSIPLPSVNESSLAGLNVTLVHDWLTGMRGGEKCLEVLCQLFPEAELLTLLHKQGSTSAAIERMNIRASFLQRLPGVESYYRYTLPLMPRAIEGLQVADDMDLVVSSSHAVAKGIIPNPGAPHVCYCHTPMRYVWHMRDDYFGQQTNAPENSISTTADSWPRPVARMRDWQLERIRQWDAATADRVTHFIANSQTVARRIEQCYGRPATVIHPPVDTEFYSPSNEPREDYYLCVSALVPYKKIALAVAACNELKRPLVIVGVGPELAKIRKLAGPTVTILGWQTDEEIRTHLRRCRALLFPGHEDFGIVPVEAQACGAPVVAFAAGGALETVQKANEKQAGSGVFFAEQSVESLSRAMLWLEANPSQLDARLARRNAERFSVETFTNRLTSYLQQVVFAAGESYRQTAA